MTPDILIKNGRVVDPARGIDEVQDIAVVRNRIVAVPDGGGAPREGEITAKQVIDASGCMVFPGLIDYHAHFYYSGAATAIKPDLMLATGVTAAVDAGTAGSANFDSFYKADLVTSYIRSKCYINVNSSGLLDEWMPEDINPKYYNEREILRIVDRYPGMILGLKVRIPENLCDSLEPLKATLRIAEKAGIGVCVHVTNSVSRMEEIAALLRPGDVFCHMYHGRRDTILDADGKIWPGLRAARERGVVFDCSHGQGNFCHRVALQAIREGFYPDVITTDIGDFKIYISHWARSLPFLMSKCLSMGMDFTSVLRAVTETPARLMGMAGQIGTLAPGAYADIALFTLEDKRVRYQDFFNDMYYGDRLFVPKFVIADGEYVWGAADFNID